MASIAFIAVVTLKPEPSVVPHHGIRILSGWSTTHLGEDLLNSLLFAPLGASAAAAHLSVRRTLILALGVSVVVELLQRILIHGRFAELQDVVFNTSGGLLAYAMVRAARSIWYTKTAARSQ